MKNIQHVTKDKISDAQYVGTCHVFFPSPLLFSSLALKIISFTVFSQLHWLSPWNNILFTSAVSLAQQKRTFPVLRLILTHLGKRAELSTV